MRWRVPHLPTFVAVIVVSMFGISTPAAAQAIEVLHAFNGGTSPPGGVSPQAALVQGPDGTLYGSTISGGTHNSGTIFKMTADGAVSVLYNFTGGADRPSARDPLIVGADGALYGTTRFGGASGNGTVFRLSPLDGSLTVLHEFNDSDGREPNALILASDGDFYGTTRFGGSSEVHLPSGTVFRMTPTGAVTTLHTFSQAVDSTEGDRPNTIMQANDGNLFGTTAGGGGPVYTGVVFRMNPAAGVTILTRFVPTGDAAGPGNPVDLIEGPDGNFYLAARSVGSHFNDHTIFRLTPAGVRSALYVFTRGSDGERIAGALQAVDGVFYGTTATGGDSRLGSVFRLGLDGTFTTLYSFTGGADGATPAAGLVPGLDGALYGTTRAGGAHGGGVIFRVVLPTSTPSEVTIAPTGGAAPRLAWAAAPRAASYTITRRDPSGNNVVLASGITATSYVDTSAIRGQTYAYTVLAVNAAGASEPSYEVSISVGRAVVGDFNGDLQSDLTVYRPSTGIWYARSASGIDGAFSQWGLNGDIPVAGDYDGDSRVDIAVFRPSTGIWYVRPSGLGGSAFYQWGLDGDVPVPGDYDGDLRTDLAVFRPSTGIWYVRYSSTDAEAFFDWGLEGDVPVAGDYDGDGKTDVAVFRPSTGIWYVLHSATGAGAFYQWGLSDDEPVAADFDGDGKTDMAVFRPSTGIWYILHSSNSSASFLQWGLTGDIPVSGDFDGDGKADVAVFRPSTGIWYVLQSTTATGAFYQWGINGDIPILERPHPVP